MTGVAPLSFFKNYFDRRVQAHVWINEEQPLPSLVTADAGAIAASLEEHGHIVLNGVQFATDEAEVLPESEAAPWAMAQYLTDNPEASVLCRGTHRWHR